MMLRTTGRLCGSCGFRTPFAIGRRVSAWNTSANFCASLPATTMSAPRTSWNTFSRNSRFSASLEYGSVRKALSWES